MEYIQDLQRQINNYIIPLISNEQLLYYINNIKQIFQDLDKNYIFNVKKIENVQTNDKIKNQIKFSSNDDDDNNNNDDNMKIGSLRDDDNNSPVVIVNDDDNNNKKSYSKSNTDKIDMKSMNEIQNDYSLKNENINQNNNNINKNYIDIPNKQQIINNYNNYNNDDDSSSDNRIIQNLNMNKVSIEELRTKYLSNDIYNNNNHYNKVNKVKKINNVKSNERLNEKILSLKSSYYNVITNDNSDDDDKHDYTDGNIRKSISENVVEDIMEVSYEDNAWYAFKKSMTRS